MHRWREREHLKKAHSARSETRSKAQESQGVRVIGEALLQLSGIYGEVRDEYEERAAIMEYDGDYSRREAERLAFGLIDTKYSPFPCP
jgi:hypothetical protein